jgi:NADH-quinone oxidoreductase subunit G
MVREPRKAYLLMNMEPSLDHAQPALAMSALGAAESVIALSAYRSPDLLDVADCLLPIAPFTETSGSFVNAAGSLQSFNGVVRPLGEARPAWKVLRVLGNLLELPGFDQDSPEQVRAQALPTDLAVGLSARIQGQGSGLSASPSTGLERIADVPLYFSDPIVRRADSLQATRDAALPTARMSAVTLARAGVQTGQAVRLAQTGGHEVLLTAQLDPEVADGVVRVAAAHACTAGLASISGAISVERA